jgi:hypothetical protein
MNSLEKLIDALETGGQKKYSFHFIKKIATKLLEEEKYCQCKKRMDQYQVGSNYVCSDCEKIIQFKSNANKS